MLVLRRVVGHSMHPTLRQGQLVVALKSANYTSGQIVIARQSGREVIKRIVDIDGEYYDLRGDNLAKSTDSRTKGPVTRQDILGRLIFIF